MFNALTIMSKNLQKVSKNLLSTFYETVLDYSMSTLTTNNRTVSKQFKLEQEPTKRQNCF